MCNIKWKTKMLNSAAQDSEIKKTEILNQNGFFSVVHKSTNFKRPHCELLRRFWFREKFKVDRENIRNLTSR